MGTIIDPKMVRADKAFLPNYNTADMALEWAGAESNWANDTRARVKGMCHDPNERHNSCRSHRRRVPTCFTVFRVDRPRLLLPPKLSTYPF